MTPMPNPALVARLRKELESVPMLHARSCANVGPFLTGSGCCYPRIDYQALAEKVAPLVEALEEVIEAYEAYRGSPTVTTIDAAQALAPWRTDAP